MRPSAPAASATPTINVSGGVTQPVFSYQDAIREHVRVQSPVDSDSDGKKDLVRVDIIRPKETRFGLKVPVIMHETPYHDEPGVGYQLDHKKYDANGNVTKFPLDRSLCAVATGVVATAHRQLRWLSAMWVNWDALSAPGVASL